MTRPELKARFLVLTRGWPWEERRYVLEWFGLSIFVPPAERQLIPELIPHAMALASPRTSFEFFTVWLELDFINSVATPDEQRCYVNEPLSLVTALHES